jgi:Tfp pilus assembly protein PilN
MQVLFDLRPPELVALQTQKVDLIRVLSVVFFLVFLMLSFYNIGWTAYKYIGIRSQLSETADKEQQAKTMLASLSAGLKEMENLKTRVVAYVEFTRNELPAVEFMKCLEDTVPAGLKVTDLTVRPGNVMIRGSALTDGPIGTFAGNLENMKYIVTRVDAPITTKATLGTRMISNFTRTCNIKSILDIKTPMTAVAPGSPTGGSISDRFVNGAASMVSPEAAKESGIVKGGAYIPK